MKLIEARKQVNLGPARALQLALSGMMYRFFRSGITVAILCLAVAFLVHTLMYGLISHSTEYRAFQEIRQQQELGGMVSRLLRADAPSMVVYELAEGDELRMQEYQTWGRLSEAQLADGQGAARRVRQAEEHFERLPEDSRAVLMGDADTLTMLRRFQQPAQYLLFRERMEQLGLVYPLDGAEDFQRLAQEEWPRTTRLVERIRSGQEDAIKQIQEAYPERGIRQLLVAPPENIPAVLQEAGYSVRGIDFEQLAVFSALIEDRERVESMLAERVVRAALIRRLNLSPDQLSAYNVFRWLQSRRGDPEWLSEQFSPAGVVLAPERLSELADFYVRSERLQKVAGDEPPTAEAGIFALEGRLRWLILLAFCVCMVGVANAMLMSVTERFTEIATMKCLGALDNFVMMMFVFEAAIQGLIGGVIGIVLGTVLALLRGGVEFGGLLTLSPAVMMQILIAALLSMAVGVVLAVLAAVGPSLVAARLAPMEAMRVE